jgi:hypothetical protein
MLKKILLCLAFFFASVTSCSERKEDIALPKTECEQIKDIVTDCLGLYRGALKYVKSCGNISLVELNSLDTCEEKLNHIENKD